MGGKRSSWSNIPQFFSKVIRSFMASPDSSPPEIEGVFTSIQSIAFTILPVNEWLDTLNGHAAETSQCFIEDVIHYKCTAGKQHEFLRFQVSHPAGPWKAFVFADRTVDTSNDNGVPTFSNKAVVLSNPPPSSSSSSTLSLRDLPAYDIVYIATENSAGLKRLYSLRFNDKHEVVRTLTYDANSTRPSVLELATLFNVTSRHAPSYNAYQNQCYWFAETIYEALAQLFPIHRQAPDARRGGTYRGLGIPMANSVQAVCAAYHGERLAIQEREEEEMRQQEALQQALRAEGREEGREEGIVKGREEGIVKGREEGIVKGREEGIVKGREEGIEQGRAEERAALEMEHAALAARERGLQRRIEELEAQSRGAAMN
ncbi:hypothetical protein BS17DRAFT_347240 [Gyrodon lividus]|nr:hypothetical protein BS17DRAFT_347240 [Gyrodon lividus]